MSLGLMISLLVTFLLLPSLINIFSSENEIDVKDTEKSFITSILGSIAKNGGFIVIITTFIIVITSFYGYNKA